MQKHQLHETLRKIGLELAYGLRIGHGTGGILIPVTLNK